ncbi:hypothetical protein [Tateyamaria pelophila]|uniref:hypothetical protein n=1 Tax=Tateyamaria pelophila TaxID=328415 RepID=UPI001CBB6499|nr:hypothetical protein [Tateyamaria pelophila]
MPRSVLITTATLVVIAALGGFWLGQRQVTLDATGVIEAVAAIHEDTHGGNASDCVGWPGKGRVVFHVRCAGMLYAVDRFGRVEIVLEDGI